MSTHVNSGAAVPGYRILSSRRTLSDSTVARVEDLRSAPAARRPRAESYSPDFQICFPYAGLFVWHVGRDVVVADANQLLFVTGGEPFALSQPRPVGFRELIITPQRGVLEALTGQSLPALGSTPLFRGRRCRANAALQRQCHDVRRRMCDGVDPLTADDLVVSLLEAALGADAMHTFASPSTRRMVDTAKAYLDAHVSVQVRLTDVARAIGTSAPYLTSAFRRVEGVPLHRYLTQLRLARALREVPHANDLADLAFALGFSSHSHFTAAFRAAFGCTPSAYRESGHLAATSFAPSRGL